MQCELYIGKRRKPVPANTSAVHGFFKQLVEPPCNVAKAWFQLSIVYRNLLYSEPFREAWQNQDSCQFVQREGLLKATAPQRRCWRTYSWHGLHSQKLALSFTLRGQESQWTLVLPAFQPQLLTPF
eukprot:s3431_g6.t1